MSWANQIFSWKEKIKKGISVKKLPVFNGIQTSTPPKNQIPKDLFADSRQQRSYGPF
jgi:hypothetical protein